MAIIEMDFASGGGGEKIEPTLLKSGYLNAGLTETIPIDNTHKYIVTTSANDRGSNFRQNVFYVENNTITTFRDDGNSAIEGSISGDTLTLRNIYSGAEGSYNVVEL